MREGGLKIFPVFVRDTRAKFEKQGGRTRDPRQGLSRYESLPQPTLIVCLQTNLDVNPGSATSPRVVTAGLSYGNIPSALDTPANVKRVALKADPALLTCFDPADKELYDLWAPQQR